MNQAIRTFILLLSLGTAAGAEQPQSARAPLTVWDTVKAASAPLTPEALAAREGWTRIARGETPGAFKGDAVVSNGRVVAVFRRLADGPEVYSVTPRGAARRARLRLLSAKGRPASRLVRLALVQHTRSSARLEASYETEEGSPLAAAFRLKRRDVSVETDPRAGAASLRVECPGRFALLPDFFADDILIDARRIPFPKIDLPSENFVLHPIADGDALAMVVFENREQEVRVTLSGKGARREITGSEIAFGRKRKAWLALLEGPGTWHSRDIAADQAGKILPLDWQMPFDAQWRVDFTRTNQLTDSWEMIVQYEDGGVFRRQEWFQDWQRRISANRKRWTTVLGRFPYPCWIDHRKKAYLQPLKHRVMTFEGPMVIYPISRVKKTPVETYTVTDILRNTLGVGPCEYILDVEGHNEKNTGINTCSVRDTFKDYFGKGIQKQKRTEIEKLMKETLAFVRHIRKRIDQYLAFGREMKEVLEARRKAHPEFAPFLDEMEAIVGELTTRADARWEKCRTPEYIAELNDTFREKVMDYTGPDLMDRVKKYGRDLTEVGDNQDELVGECRWVVKALRQRAGLAMAKDPRVAGIAEEIRKRAQRIMRNPSALERVRH